MIVKTLPKDILKTDIKHIAFAINKEGYNDAGFAGQVSYIYWPELANIWENEIGTVLSRKFENKVFHAVVCHSLKEGWGNNQRETIRKCFDNIPSNGEPIATIAIGTGLIGQLSGANFPQILCGMHDSQQQVILCANLTMDDVKAIYDREKGKMLLK